MKRNGGVLLCLMLSPALKAQEELPWSVEKGIAAYTFAFEKKPVVHYRWKDADIRRPFFFHLHAPDGNQVTRNHPPIPGKDAADHDTMHPGMWLSFGDLNGQDFWRNKARVWKDSEAFFQGNPFTFTDHLVYYDKDENGEEGRQQTTVHFLSRPEGYLLLLKAQFRAKDKDMVFGDQEEMGLGIRMHTELTVKAGGTIKDSAGRRDEKGIWGKTAKWCAYYRDFGKDRGHRGVAIFPDPANFRPSWWHVRDYGLMVANPFGQNAFTGKEKSRVVVKKGETLTLRYGVLIFSRTGKAPAMEKAYEDYLEVIKSLK